MSKSSVEGHPRQREIVDALLAGRSVREIAAWSGVGRQSLQRYRERHVVPTLRQAITNSRNLDRSPLQKALQGSPQNNVQPILSAREIIKNQPILAIREHRLELLQGRHDKLTAIVKARAATPSKVPGAETGLLDSDGRVDRPLLASFMEHEKAAAIESGQWNEASVNNFAIQIVMPQRQPADFDSAIPVVNIALPRQH